MDKQNIHMKKIIALFILSIFTVSIFTLVNIGVISNVVTDQDNLDGDGKLNGELNNILKSSNIPYISNPNSKYMKTLPLEGAYKIALYDQNKLIIAVKNSSDKHTLCFYKVHSDLSYDWISNFTDGDGNSEFTVLKVNGDTLYVGTNEPDFYPLNITNPLNPYKHVNYPMSRVPYDALIEGDLLYLSTQFGQDKLICFDIGDPSNMMYKWQVFLNTPNIKNINRVGKYILCGNDFVNTTDITNPQVLNSAPFPWYEQILTIGNTAYLLGSRKTLSVYDMTYREAITSMNSISTDQEWASKMVKFGRTLVTIGFNLVFVNITDLNNPNQIGVIGFNQHLRDIILYGDKIFIAGENSVLFGYYAHPVKEVHFDDAYIGDLQVPAVENFAYGGDFLTSSWMDVNKNQFGGIQFYDISDLTNMYQYSSYDVSYFNDPASTLYRGFLIGGNKTIDIESFTPTVYDNPLKYAPSVYGQNAYVINDTGLTNIFNVYNMKDMTDISYVKSWDTLTDSKLLISYYENFMFLYNRTSWEIYDLGAGADFTLPLLKEYKNDASGGYDFSIFPIGANIFYPNESISYKYELYDGGALPNLDEISHNDSFDSRFTYQGVDNFIVQEFSNQITILDASDPFKKPEISTSFMMDEQIIKWKMDGDLLWIGLGGEQQSVRVYQWLRTFAGDEDEDGINGLIEAYKYSTNPQNNDTDFDGMDDLYEITYDILNPNLYDALDDPDDDDLVNYMEYKQSSNPDNNDTDNDRLLDGQEVYEVGTDPTKSDSDSDTIPDFEDDQDGDNLPNGDELLNDADPKKYDSDYDGVNDFDEVLVFGSDPRTNDTDNDGLTDYMEAYIISTNPNLADTDGDGLDDSEEFYQHNTNPLSIDTDGDTLNDSEEINWGSSPLVKDTDFDGLTDPQEKIKGTDPNVADSDSDGLTDFQEINTYLTNPLLNDTDGDGWLDGKEVLEEGTDPKVADTDGDMINDPQDFDPLDSWYTLVGTFGSVLGGLAGIYFKMRSFQKQQNLQLGLNKKGKIGKKGKKDKSESRSDDGGVITPNFKNISDSDN